MTTIRESVKKDIDSGLYSGSDIEIRAALRVISSTTLLRIRKPTEHRKVNG
jgi:hypothetical protein